MFGWDAGAGVMGFFNDHVGLRGDVRYLRATHDLNSGISSIDLNGNQLHFWRAVDRRRLPVEKEGKDTEVLCRPLCP